MNALCNIWRFMIISAAVFVCTVQTAISVENLYDRLGIQDIETGVHIEPAAHELWECLKTTEDSPLCINSIAGGCITGLMTQRTPEEAQVVSKDQLYLDETACLFQEFTAWTMVMYRAFGMALEEAAYKETYSAESIVQPIYEAQSDWHLIREKECGAIWQASGTDARGGYNFITCLRDQTAQRTLHLRTMFDSVNKP